MARATLRRTVQRWAGIALLTLLVSVLALVFFAWYGASVFGALSGIVPGSAGQSRPDVVRFEAQVVLPPAAEPLENYARFYPPVRRYRVDDLPFTTVDVDALPFDMGDHFEAAPPEAESPPLGVGILVLRSTGIEVQKGRHLVQQSDVPQVFHGRCGVVNVTFDPRTGRTLSIWCNVPTR